MKDCLFYFAFLIPLAAVAQATNATECEIIRPDSEVSKPYISIIRPGSYCLDRDYTFVCYPWMHSCMGRFIRIKADDVRIDMRGHSLRAVGTSAYDGIWISGDRVSIKNGKISGVGLALRIADARGSPPFSNVFEKHEPLKLYSGEGGGVIENMGMAIASSLGPVLYIATNNMVIKNSHIRGSVAIAGEGHRVEHNEIRFEAPEIVPGWREAFRVAVVARKADGLLMKDNNIAVSGDRASVRGISIFDSKNVYLVNNKIVGAATPVDLSDSTVSYEEATAK